MVWEYKLSYSQGKEILKSEISLEINNIINKEKQGDFLFLTKYVPMAETSSKVTFPTKNIVNHTTPKINEEKRWKTKRRWHKALM